MYRFYILFQEGPVVDEPDIKHVVGHRFTGRDSKSSKHYCEKCSGVIWGVLQTWYRCLSKFLFLIQV